MNKKILLSFDVEEFDVPLEYNQDISTCKQLQVGYSGLQAMEHLFDLTNIRCTLFTTARFAENFPDDIRKLSTKHEIASHSYYHSSFQTEHLKQSKDKLEAIIGKTIYGFRTPRMKSLDSQLIAAAGYRYDSSLHPAWIPGRYNNLKCPRKVFKENGLIEIPASVTPRVRVPLFWLAFKNMPHSFYLNFAIDTLHHDGYLCLYFHPWELVDLSQYKLPFYFRKGESQKLFRKMTRLIHELSDVAEFVTMNEFIDDYDFNNDHGTS
jgi:polysaccharide deacetylase